MNNLDQIETTAKRSKALREAATKALRLSDQCAIDFLIESHKAALDEVCLSLVKEVRELRAELQAAYAERDEWESTAKRFAAESGEYENTDYLRPDDDD